MFTGLSDKAKELFPKDTYNQALCQDILLPRNLLHENILKKKKQQRYSMAWTNIIQRNVMILKTTKTE